MKNIAIYQKKFIIVSLIFLAALLAAGPAGADVPAMNKEQLKKIIDQKDVIVIDVRSGRDWSSSEFKIQGAVRENPGDVSNWLGKYAKDKTIVLYCA